MYIVGPAKGITISGNHQHRVIEGRDDNGGVSLTNVTVTKGYDPYYASAIRATSLYLQNSTVQDNRGPGSAIRVRYGFAATNSTISRTPSARRRSSTVELRVRHDHEQHHRLQRARGRDRPARPDRLELLSCWWS